MDDVLESIEWLVANNHEIPEDILGEIDSFLGKEESAIKIIKELKESVEEIKNKPEPIIPAPVVNIDFESVAKEISNLANRPNPNNEIYIPEIKIPVINVPEIKIPEQKPPVINVIMPKMKKSTQRFIRDRQTGEIVSSETSYEYVE